jgi:hypothetical protein
VGSIFQTPENIDIEASNSPGKLSMLTRQHEGCCDQKAQRVSGCAWSTTTAVPSGHPSDSGE